MPSRHMICACVDDCGYSFSSSKGVRSALALEQLASGSLDAPDEAGEDEGDEDHGDIDEDNR